MGRDPVEPQRGDDEESEADPVGSDHRPAAVQLAAGAEETGQRAEQDRAEEQRGEDPDAEDGGDGEGRTAVSAAEGPFGGGRLKGQQNQHQQGEGITDAAHQLGAPQAAQPGGAQQCAHRTLAGVRG